MNPMDTMQVKRTKSAVELALANLITAVFLILLLCSPAIVWGVWAWLVG